MINHPVSDEYVCNLQESLLCESFGSSDDETSEETQARQKATRGVKKVRGAKPTEVLDDDDEKVGETDSRDNTSTNTRDRLKMVQANRDTRRQSMERHKRGAVGRIHDYSMERMRKARGERESIQATKDAAKANAPFEASEAARSARISAEKGPEKVSGFQRAMHPQAGKIPEPPKREVTPTGSERVGYEPENKMPTPKPSPDRLLDQNKPKTPFARKPSAFNKYGKANNYGSASKF